MGTGIDRNKATYPYFWRKRGGAGGLAEIAEAQLRWRSDGGQEKGRKEKEGRHEESCGGIMAGHVRVNRSVVGPSVAVHPPSWATRPPHPL
jgi:hypothetical protein